MIPSQLRLACKRTPPTLPLLPFCCYKPIVQALGSNVFYLNEITRSNASRSTQCPPYILANSGFRTCAIYKQTIELEQCWHFTWFGLCSAFVSIACCHSASSVDERMEDTIAASGQRKEDAKHSTMSLTQQSTACVREDVNNNGVSKLVSLKHPPSPVSK